MSITLTRKEACELIRSYIGKKDGPKGEDLNKIVFAANNDFQVRDFMLGLPEYYDTQEIIDFMCHMANEAPLIEDAPFIAINAELAKLWPAITRRKDPLPDHEKWAGVSDKLQYLDHGTA
jgi:hypothetical protein